MKLGQTYEKREILVINDASDDQNATANLASHFERVRSFDESIRIIENIEMWFQLFRD